MAGNEVSAHSLLEVLRSPQVVQFDPSPWSKSAGSRLGFQRDEIERLFVSHKSIETEDQATDSW